MRSTKYLAAAVTAAATLVIGTVADAKGPQGGAGAGADTTHAAAPGSQGIGSNTWTQPPGSSNATDSKGWDGASSPPGWDKNTTGQAKGWDGATSPPGIEKR